MTPASSTPVHRSRLRRDFVLDHTPLLQKTVGETSPQEILQQLADLDTVEARFRTLTH